MKKTVTLDADLVAVIGDGNLSVEVNEALSERLHRLQRARSLQTYLDQYAAAEGPPTRRFETICTCSADLPVRNPVLDAEAVQPLVQPDHPSRRQVHHLLEAASRLQRDVVIPAVTLAELYRGVRRTQHVDAAVAPHEQYLKIRDTDRALPG